MNNIIRLVYASQSKERRPGALAIEVGRILRKSRENNARVGIGGVLYFGNGFFFQCLEGEEKHVLETFKRISGDKRHHNVKTLMREPLGKMQFKHWSMKFVPAEDSIQAFLKIEGLREFLPYDFDQQQVRRLLNHLQGQAADGTNVERPAWWHKIPFVGSQIARRAAKG